MRANLRFKTITFLLLLLATFTFLVSFLINIFYESREIIGKQVDSHNHAMSFRLEEGLRTYLDGVEDNLLTIRSNESMIESFYRGDQANFLATLSAWEEEFEKVRYDFIAVSFHESNRCFLFAGYFTKLHHLSCDELIIRKGGMDNYGWNTLQIKDTLLGVYTINLDIKSSGKVIGQLAGGVKLSDNQYLLEKLSFYDQNDLRKISFQFDNQPISTVEFPSTRQDNWLTTLLAMEQDDTVVTSLGDTVLGDNFKIQFYPDNDIRQDLRLQFWETMLFGCVVALLISLLIAFTLSSSVDTQLQSLILFARKAHADKRTTWRKTNISDFNAIGEEIVQIMRDLKQKEEMLERTNTELIAINEDKRRILHHLISSQEHERSRISNDLHDDMSQLLAVVHINLITLKDQLMHQDASKETVSECLNIINLMYDKVYNRIESLRPFEMNDFGLSVSIPKVPTVKQLEMQDYGVLMELEQEKPLKDEIKSNLYRITQEALTNIMKHAKGTLVTIKLKDELQGLRLIIEDDGVGLPSSLKKEATRGGFGLMSIQERADYMNATLSIGPGTDNEGVAIDVFVPAEHAYANAHTNDT